MPGCDTVIHLGAAFQFGRKARHTNEETNVCGTKYLLEAGERSGIKQFVHVSSCGVLEGRRELLSEFDFPNDVGTGESYRRSKWLGEMAAFAAERPGLP